MHRKRLAWLGTLLVAEVGVWLAWLQVADHLPQWSQWLAFAGVALGFLLGFPLSEDEDGHTTRLYKVRLHGKKNALIGNSSSANVQNTGSGNVNIHNGLDPAQLISLNDHLDEEVALQVQVYVDRRMEAFNSDLRRYTGEAHDTALELGRSLMSDFVSKLASDAPQNIQSLRRADMQGALLAAQKGAAIGDNGDLSEVLVTMLIEKSATEARSLKGIVLNEAIDAAAKLTIEQIDLLTAALILRRTIFSEILDVDTLFRVLAGHLPDIRNCPDSATLPHLSYVGVATIDPTRDISPHSGIHADIADILAERYDGILTNGFTREEFGNKTRNPFQSWEATFELMKYQRSIEVISAKDDGTDVYRMRVASSDDLESRFYFGDDIGMDPDDNPYWPMKQGFQDLLRSCRMSSKTVLRKIRATDPELQLKLGRLEQCNIAALNLTPVGVALAQANWHRLDPASALPLDHYFK
ncbi:LPO_1073/Vpar_1526 family protein [Gordonia sp. FQ]|uniref:LPO_1073/Vpar_1526 family protein n=1 Tax=Gordonia sp. FQ TaxID=3446634 RepID=UPI003F873C13